MINSAVMRRSLIMATIRKAAALNTHSAQSLCIRPSQRNMRDTLNTLTVTRAVHS
jgi:hypothetical protein